MKVTVEVEVTPPGEIDEAARIAASLIGEDVNSEYARGIVEFIADSYGWVVGNSWLDVDQKQGAIRELIKAYTHE